jgi:hypothetical protein
MTQASNTSRAKAVKFKVSLTQAEQRLSRAQAGYRDRHGDRHGGGHGDVRGTASRSRYHSINLATVRELRVRAAVTVTCTLVPPEYYETRLPVRCPSQRRIGPGRAGNVWTTDSDSDREDTQASSTQAGTGRAAVRWVAAIDDSPFNPS